MFSFTTAQKLTPEGAVYVPAVDERPVRRVLVDHDERECDIRRIRQCAISNGREVGREEAVDGIDERDLVVA